MAREAALRHDPQFAHSSFRHDVIAGLSARPKHIPPKYFYDAAGSELFEQITLLPEYYPTRTELKILRDRGAEIAKFVPQGAALVEFGAGVRPEPFGRAASRVRATSTP